MALDSETEVGRQRPARLEDTGAGVEPARRATATRTSVRVAIGRRAESAGHEEMEPTVFDPMAVVILGEHDHAVGGIAGPVGDLSEPR